MFRTLSTIALVVLSAVGRLAAIAEEPKTGGNSKVLPKELSVDLGKGVKLEMVLVPAGEFLMGSPDSDKDAGDEEKPQHRVRITKPFYLGKYLVTQEQWQTVMGSNPSHFTDPKNPVEEVSWDDCRLFLDKLDAKIGSQHEKFSLPTEAQWEYACRAGSGRRYYFGDDEADLGDYGWCLANADNKPRPIGQKKPNACGLYDMHGNVGEWCQDWYGGGYYAASKMDDPNGPATGTNRVNRGGGWDRPARYSRAAYRSYYSPGFRLDYVGVRVCLALTGE